MTRSLRATTSWVGRDARCVGASWDGAGTGGDASARRCTNNRFRCCQQYGSSLKRLSRVSHPTSAQVRPGGYVLGRRDGGTGCQPRVSTSAGPPRELIPPTQTSSSCGSALRRPRRKPEMSPNFSRHITSSSSPLHLIITGLAMVLTLRDIAPHELVMWCGVLPGIGRRKPRAVGTRAGGSTGAGSGGRVLSTLARRRAGGLGAGLRGGLVEHSLVLVASDAGCWSIDASASS